jgi:glycosyltransferase involved in cell wall biosynthesis
VIVPAYNAERFLADALASLAAQTFAGWEALVVDDGSTDGTVRIARAHAARDPRIVVLRQPSNHGVSQARNRALQEARGELVAFLDADDQWLPEKLERQVEVLTREEVDVVYCAPVLCDRDCRPQREPDWSAFCGHHSGRAFFVLQYTSFFLLPSSVMMRKEVLELHGGFDQTLRSSEDWEMWLRLSQAGCRFYGMPERLLLYRRHPDSLSVEGDFDAALDVFPRFADSPWLGPAERHKPFRLHFRNSFTYLGRRNAVGGAKKMFDAYQPHDRDGYACRVMGWLRHLLPVTLFWWLCRYAVIPLAWHLERWQERRGR